MVRRIGIPKCYGDFHCIADACTDSCCAGWQVDVDDASWAYYKTVKGEFGDYLHSVMVEIPDEEGQFQLQKDGRCPFLNDNGLCDMYSNLGEEKLCKTCTNYPRYMEDYGELREMGLAFSCPEAARLMLESSAPMEFEEFELGEDETKWCSMVKDVMWRSETNWPNQLSTYVHPYSIRQNEGDMKEVAEKGYRIDMNAFDEDYFQVLYECRKTAFAIVQERSLSIEQRVLLYLDFAVKLQEALDGACEQESHVNEEFARRAKQIRCCYGEADELTKRYCQIQEMVAQWPENEDAFMLYEEPVPFGRLRYTLLPEYAAVLYQELKHCKPQWGPLLSQAEEVLHQQMEEDTYAQMYREFGKCYRQREYEYEHLLSYFVFKYFLKSYFDDDIYGKAQLAVVGYLMVKELAVCQWIRQGKKYTKADQAELFHLYSREMEHSDENYDEFVDSLKMENMCNYEHLTAILVEGSGWSEDVGKKE